MLWILTFLPRKWLSRFVGFLMHINLPGPLALLSIEAFAGVYNIKVNEAEKSLDQYPSIGKFFSRRLKKGARPISSAWAIHPSDSEILQSGPITNGTLIQAKGRVFDVVGLTEDPEAIEKYKDGYFLTYYLCPTDYHRVHSPVGGFIKSVMYRNGDLWPVNKNSVLSIKNLYIQNERLMAEMATEFGPVGVVMVGATNVGSMTLAFDKNVRTNRLSKSKRHIYPVPIEIQKGDEFGTFHMGSTVIVIYSKEFRKKFESQFSISRKVKVGQALTAELDKSTRSSKSLEH